MAITERQHQLRWDLEACRTPDDARTIIAAYNPHAVADWAHIAKSLRVFDQGLVESLVQHPEAIDYLGRNKALPAALREWLYVWLADTLERGLARSVLRVSITRKRNPYGSAGLARLIALATGPFETNAEWNRKQLALELLTHSADLPESLQVDLAIRAFANPDTREMMTWDAWAPATWSPRSFQRVFRAGLAVAPDAVADGLLSVATTAQLATLTPEDIAPLLTQVVNTRTRLLAVTAMGGVTPRIAQPQAPGRTAP
jgi:hypothetical protein